MGSRGRAASGGGRGRARKPGALGRPRAPRRKGDSEAIVRPIRATEDAEAEFEAAARWYEANREGLGTDFVAAVREARAVVERHPEIGSQLPNAKRFGVRRLVVQRFPYQLIYYVRPHDIVLVAVAHMRRRPGYWNGGSSLRPPNDLRLSGRRPPTRALTRRLHAGPLQPLC